MAFRRTYDPGWKLCVEWKHQMVLIPTLLSTRVSTSFPPIYNKGEEEYEVEQIIDSKQQKGKWFYLIKWKGYGPEDNSWEPEELLDHSQEEIKRFNQARLRKACDAAKSL
ncbi:Transposon Tf2-1 polyprotein [Rhizoctonia solani]|uniref:Transposon Tf2-1 polyprotein n=1 Tax=Rhizoctonia solani TaxID=456999 RepID=A0A8H8P7G2_9AGAM|nr:Transposon Tf2-1 polyprotein [Rhizoctonia solani]QRW26585.1 Transposon Tf2-1 polyprotein [Rhizoctonia solani]